MTDLTEQRLGWLFGVAGAALFAIAGIVALVVGAADFVVGRMLSAVSVDTQAILLFVVAGLAFLFAYLGHRTWSNRPLTVGVALVVVAAIGWVVLGLGDNVIALVGAILVFLAGVLQMIAPTIQGVKTLAAA
jgi:hypothetical protein